MNKRIRHSPEIKERAIRLVQEQRREHSSQWATIVCIATKIGCTAEALREWIKQHDIDQGKREGLSTTERERMKALEREVRELRQANEILRKASAYFVQAELERPSKK